MCIRDRIRDRNPGNGAVLIRFDRQRLIGRCDKQIGHVQMFVFLHRLAPLDMGRHRQDIQRQDVLRKWRQLRNSAFLFGFPQRDRKQIDVYKRQELSVPIDDEPADRRTGRRQLRDR